MIIDDECAGFLLSVPDKLIQAQPTYQPLQPSIELQVLFVD
jgi:hypothetical protein